MKTTIVYDGKNRPIGRLIESSDGNVRAHDSKMVFLGQYNKSQNRTSDAMNRPFGNGNMARALIH